MSCSLPKFIALTDALRKEIRQKKAGERFHTQKEVMAKYNVSCATVSRAMQELTEEGLLQRITGKGTFIRSNTPKQKSFKEERELFLMLNPPENLQGVQQLSWFIHAQTQQGVINAFHGNCRICNEKEFMVALDLNQIPMAILMNPEYATVQKLHQEKIPHIIISQNQVHWESNFIHVNHMSGVLEAVTFLHRELKHRRIALVSMNNPAHSDRIGAFRIAMQTLHLTLPEEYIVFTPGGTPDDGAQAVETLLSLPVPPTAILADTDQKAFGVLRYLQSHRIRVPEELSLIGFDDLPECEQTLPPLTSIHCSFVTIGKMAVEMLEDLLQTGQWHVRGKNFLSTLVPRSSCGICPEETGG